MPRIVKEYAVRRNEILDAAQRLIYTKGYERMTIQDILDDLHIAKGLFYYYFVSKQAMLVALTERLMDASAQAAEPIVNDPELRTLEKIGRFFAAIVQTETEQKTILLALLPVWYMDENAVVREKMRSMVVKYHAPLLNTIIQQGIKEGVMRTAYPDQAVGMALLLFEGLKEALAQRLLATGLEQSQIQPSEHIIAAYTDALERILGIPSHTLHLADSQVLEQWLGVPGELAKKTAAARQS
jgi:TetR/AcrR family transcriptional repressor of nem operon